MPDLASHINVEPSFPSQLIYSLITEQRFLVGSGNSHSQLLFRPRASFLTKTLEDLGR